VRFSTAAVLAVLGLAVLLGPSQALAGDGEVSAAAASRASAVSGPIISISPTSHDFGRVNVASSSGNFGFTISNTGDATLHISAVTHSGSGFSASAGSSSIPAGGSTTLSTSYTPSGSGPQSDNVTIASDASNGPANVLLQGIANNAPVFSPALAATYSATAFVLFTLTASAMDGESDDMGWSISGQPSGSTFDSSTGTLSWTPNSADVGSYPVTITVSDGLASTAGAFTLVVTGGAAGNQPPSISWKRSKIANEGSLIHLLAMATDPDAGNTITMTQSGMPSSLTFTTAGGNPDSAIIAGRLSFADGGTTTRIYPIVWTATDNGEPSLSASVITYLTVNNVDRAPTVTAPATIVGDENTPITFTVAASDPDADVISSLTGAPLPAGATFTTNANNSSGTFSWTPTTGQAGTYTLTFRASNASQGLTITVISFSHAAAASCCKVWSEVYAPFSEGIPTQVAYEGSGSGKMMGIAGTNTLRLIPNSPGFGDAWVILPTTVHPSPSDGMIYDEKRNVVVTSDSRQVDFGAGPGKTWEWNGSDWKEFNAYPGLNLYLDQDEFLTRDPSLVYGGDGITYSIGGVKAAAAGDSTNGRVDYSCLRNGLWGWDGAEWKVIPVENGEEPGLGYCESDPSLMAYDSDRDVVVFFDGSTWELVHDRLARTRAWSQKTPSKSPDPNYLPATGNLAYDKSCHVTVMTGVGQSGRETWKWDGVNWTLMEDLIPISLNPFPAYDPIMARVVVTGSQTWEWKQGVPPVKVVAYYPTCDPVDGSTYGNDGTRLVPPNPQLKPACAPGAVGADAFNFVGPAGRDGRDYVQVPNDPSLNFPCSQMSVCAWVKTGYRESGGGVILFKRDAYLLYYTSQPFCTAKSICFEVAGSDPVCVSTPISDGGSWHHIGVTVDLSAGISFYWDGALLGTSPGPISGSLESTNDLFLGGNGLPIGFIVPDFVGAIDELTIYRGVISADEVKKCFDARPSSNWPALACGSLMVCFFDNLHNPFEFTGGVSTVSTTAGSAVTWTVEVSDPDDTPITSLTAGPLPVGASFTVNASKTLGTFNWTPTFSQNGIHDVTVTAANDLSGSATLRIIVGRVNRAPIASAGGPYLGVIGAPVNFDGTGSSDPDGDPLTFAWDFGDALAGSGATPSHAYTAASTNNVCLKVTDNGVPSLSDSICTTATIGDFLAVRCFRTGGSPVRLNSNKPRECFEIEPVQGDFPLNDVVLSTIQMKYGANRILAEGGKTTAGKDTDANGVLEIKACFRRGDLQTLFTGLPPGKTAVTVPIEGDLTTGARFHGDVTFVVDKTGSASSLASLVSPNPLNPEAELTFSMAMPGFAEVRMYDIQGRLVRTLLHGAFIAAGDHEVTINGRGDRGERLASGVYIVSGRTVNGTFRILVTVLR
jgi:concanavalin A-like lectin/glucanase superfamily protein/PKD domain-containing protein/uncharacterized protein DUF1573/putative Ig domain-containing protein/flagellar hook capping protein FlgD